VRVIGEERRGERRGEEREEERRGGERRVYCTAQCDAM
jgi:hypothetical protein